ncbi:STAS domain-containing protein [Streptomyces sp. NPDC048330]|uniref:STAS domain-containing protein n=1 Tax=Streptomyces sp. NPDC048330 TaxID=3365533 RepID=UPI0037200616
MSDLILTTHEDPDGMIITVAGELDFTSCHHLEIAACQAVLPDGALLRIDMSHVTCMDSSGLNLLLMLRRRLVDIGGRLLLISVQGVPMQVLILTGAETLLLPADTPSRR